jgi:hypothetical protein
MLLRVPGKSIADIKQSTKDMFQKFIDSEFEKILLGEDNSDNSQIFAFKLPIVLVLLKK